MRYEDVRDRLNSRLFRPVRLVQTDGTAYVVDQPNTAVVTRSYVAIFMADDPNEPTVLARQIQLDLKHLVRIEELGEPGQTFNFSASEN